MKYFIALVVWNAISHGSSNHFALMVPMTTGGLLTPELVGMLIRREFPSPSNPSWARSDQWAKAMQSFECGVLPRLTLIFTSIYLLPCSLERFYMGFFPFCIIWVVLFSALASTINLRPRGQVRRLDILGLYFCKVALQRVVNDTEGVAPPDFRFVVQGGGWPLPPILS